MNIFLAAASNLWTGVQRSVQGMTGEPTAQYVNPNINQYGGVNGVYGPTPTTPTNTAGSILPSGTLGLVAVIVGGYLFVGLAKSIFKIFK